MRMILLITTLIITTSLIAKPQFKNEGLKRLDPHGKKNIKLNSYQIKKGSDCLVCHSYSKKDGRVHLRKRVENHCTDCHNKSPHAGMIEHEGKRLEPLKIGLKGRINCLSCHRAHRALLSKEHKKHLEDNIINNSTIFSRKIGKLDESKVHKQSVFPMLIRACTDCHTPKNLH